MEAMGKNLPLCACTALACLAIGVRRPATAANPDVAATAAVDDEDGGLPTLGKWSPWRKCASPTSTLAIESSGFAMHENDTTQGHVLLRTRDGKDLGGYLWGTVGCLAYSQPTGKYVLGQVGGLAAWRPLLSLLYLDETTGKLTSSRAPPAPTEHGEWCALTAVASDDGRFIAFVSSSRDRIGLEVLDTKRDCIIRIGRPPLPPPSTWAEENVGKPSDFVWGASEAGTDGFVGMDPGILVWRGHVLEASYGRDLPTKRAGLRSKKSWSMAALAGKCLVGRPVVKRGKADGTPEPEFAAHPAPTPTGTDIFDIDFSKSPSP